MSEFKAQKEKDIEYLKRQIASLKETGQFNSQPEKKKEKDIVSVLEQNL